MVSTHPPQSSTTSGPSSSTSLPPTTSFSTLVLRDIRRIRPFHLPTSGSAISSPYDTFDTLVSTTTEESTPSATLGRSLDSLQCLFRTLNGRIPPRRYSPHPGLPEQATRCNRGNMVENLHSTNLVAERQEWSLENAWRYGHERAFNATRAFRSCNLSQPLFKCNSIFGGKERNLSDRATISDILG